MTSSFATGLAESPSAAKAPITVRRRSMLSIAAAAVVWQAATGSRPSLAAEALNGPGQAVQKLNAGLTKVMQAGGTTPFGQRYQMLAPVVDQTFDLSAVLRASVGPRWSALPPQDQQQLLSVFRQYTIASFVANFDHYNGASSVSGSRALPNGDAAVDSNLGGTDLSFVLRTSSGGWRVVDVLANGTISRVAVQRSDFRELLQQGGGQALLGSLQRKVHDLSGGSLA